jgi:Apea-like HEPN
MNNSALHGSLLELCPYVAPLFDKKIFDHEAWKKIQEGNYYKRCEELMRNDPDISSHIDQLVGTRISKSQQSAADYILKLLERVFERPRQDYTREFSKAYEEFERFFGVSEIDTEIIAPLTNFLMVGSAGIDFDNGTKIRRLFPDIREDFSQLVLESHRRFVFDLGTFQAAGSAFCLYSIVTEKKLIGNSTDADRIGESSYMKTIAEMDRVVACMRLYQAGHIGYPLIMQRPTVWLPISLGSTWKSGSTSIRAMDKYHIAATKVEELTGSCNRHIAALNSAPKDIQLANRRFNFTYDRDISEDALVDLVIALESLFLEEETSELGYRMAMRVAGLLHDRGAERQTTFELIQKAYQTRNRIVHGGVPPLKIKFMKNQLNSRNSFRSLKIT